jgi:hypothetical protein
MTQAVAGVRLGLVETQFSLKASLVLAPDLRDLVEPMLCWPVLAGAGRCWPVLAGAGRCWPVLAVAPDRDFVCLCNAEHREFAQRLATVVLRE